MGPSSLRPVLKAVRMSKEELSPSHELALDSEGCFEGIMREEERLLGARAAQFEELDGASGDFSVPLLAFVLCSGLVEAGVGLVCFVSEVYRIVEEEKARCGSLRVVLAHLVDVAGDRSCVSGDAWQRSKASAAFRSSIVDLMISQ